ncbi:MAG: metal-binding protein [Oculatellaceae cyanobacterium bins.114]|nr:metal-binding protein [Oculatellaceae cyanobacterium bins.114]
MPSGRTHDRITLWTLPLTGGLTLITTQSSTLTLIICSGYLFGGLMFGPDLDIHSVHFKRWGWFRWIWIPYRGSIKHRSPFSHSPITGTALRIVYLLAWVGLVSFITLALMNELWQLGWTWSDIISFLGRSLQQRQWEWLTLCLGLELGALSHYIADGILSTYKRFKTKGWKALQPPPLRPVKRKSAPKRRASSKSSVLSAKRRPRP